MATNCPPPSPDPKAEELLLFSQVIQNARGSGIPLSRFLTEASANMPPGQASAWAASLGKGLSQGQSPADVLAGFSSMDEVLAALLSVPGGLGLREVLTAYVRHLVLMVRLDDHLRTALFHPFIVLWLAIGNIVLVNVHLFPQMAAAFAEMKQPLPILIHVWYCASPATWPFSVLLPGLVLVMAVLATRIMFFRPRHVPPDLLFGGLIGLHRFAQQEEQGRLLGTLALFLEAGKPLAEALRLTARHGGARRYQAEFLRDAEQIEQGVSPVDALANGPALQPLALGWVEEGDEKYLVERLRFLAEVHLESANRMVGTIESFGTIVGLVTIGWLVLLLCLAFFQPYWALAGHGMIR